MTGRRKILPDYHYCLNKNRSQIEAQLLSLNKSTVADELDRPGVYGAR